MAILASFLQLLLITSVAQASPLSFLWRRAVLPNEQIVGLSETVPDGIAGQLYEAYQPFLDVYNGCVPSPAVDAAGNTKYLHFQFYCTQSIYI